MVEEALFAMNPPVRYERPVVVAATPVNLEVFRSVMVDVALFTMREPVTERAVVEA
jgi:hypothetical protein